jgi:hypothetical protein
MKQFDDRAIRCAGCGFGHGTHHYRTEVFNRDKEDSEIGTHVTVQRDKVVQGDDAQTNNPSSRRDGIRILTWCENCPAVTAIEISQHKGMTHLSTREAPPEIQNPKWDH